MQPDRRCRRWSGFPWLPQVEPHAARNIGVLAPTAGRAPGMHDAWCGHGRWSSMFASDCFAAAIFATCPTLGVVVRLWIPTRKPDRSPVWSARTVVQNHLRAQANSALLGEGYQNTLSGTATTPAGFQPAHDGHGTDHSPHAPCHAWRKASQGVRCAAESVLCVAPGAVWTETYRRPPAHREERPCRRMSTSSSNWSARPPSARRCDPQCHRHTADFAARRLVPGGRDAEARSRRHGGPL